jgi:hypothetical protein
MSCVRHAFPLVLATAMSVTGIAAELSAPAAAAAQTSGEASSVAAERPAILATPTAPATAPNTAAEPKQPNRARAISPATAAQLTAALPKFEQPPAASAATPAANPTPPDSAVDLREVDRPRNTIIRLPSYLVQEEKPVILTERDVRTPRARLHLALQKHPGLRLGSFWIFRNDGIALAMLAEEERLEQKQYFEDLVQLTQFSDPGTKATAKQGVEHAFMRTADFGR